jgi:hypothetical protein
MTDNVVQFPTAYETPPQAAPELIEVRRHRTGPLWGGVAVCGCLRGGVVFGSDCIDWIAGPNCPATVR